MRRKLFLSLLGLIVLFVTSCEENVQETADYLYSRAKFYEYQGNENIAIEKLEKALEKDPENMEMMHRIGGLYSKKGMYDKAEAMYQKIITADQNNYQAYICMGNLAYYREKYNDAIGYWKKAVDINPDLKKDTKSHFNNVGMNVIQKPYAAVENEKWREDSGMTKVDYTMSNAYGVMGEMYFKRGLYEKAIKEWEKVLKMSPGSFAAQQAELNIAETKKKFSK